MISTDSSLHHKSKFYVLSKGLQLQALYVKSEELCDELSVVRDLKIYG